MLDYIETDCELARQTLEATPDGSGSSNRPCKAARSDHLPYLVILESKVVDLGSRRATCLYPTTRT